MFSSFFLNMHSVSPIVASCFIAKIAAQPTDFFYIFASFLKKSKTINNE